MAKLTKRTWFNVVLFGFMGQLAWNVENVYFNTFLFNKVGGTTKDINVMVAASAAAAVLTTFIMGALSDRTGRRKPFIGIGYILWGLTVTAFAFISRENTARLFGFTDTAKIVAVTVSMVIVMDCVMTFMGSTCNDAAFNAWVTDMTDDTNRGSVESVNAILPVAAMVLVTVGFGAGATSFGYPACFLALGGLVMVCGVLGLFTLQEPPRLQASEGDYFKNLVYGFRPSVVRENSRLYWVLGAQCLANIAMQVVMPYVLIYVQHYLRFDFNNAIETLTGNPLMLGVAAVGVAVFAALVIGFGKLTDKRGRDLFLLPAVVLQIAGYALVFPMKNIFTFACGLLVFGLGSLAFGVVVSAAVRDNTPPDRAGAFQGVRMIFNVLLPMVIGPAIGSAAIERFSGLHALGNYVNDYGETVAVPVPEIFLCAAIVSALILVPALVLHKKGLTKKRSEQILNPIILNVPPGKN